MFGARNVSCHTTRASLAESAYEISELQGEVEKNEKQAAEYLYHLNRINSSPWWRFGMWVARKVNTPFSKSFLTKPIFSPKKTLFSQAESRLDPFCRLLHDHHRDIALLSYGNELSFKYPAAVCTRAPCVMRH